METKATDSTKPQGLTYCRPRKKRIGRMAMASKRYCMECGMKIRGPGHSQGQHHISKGGK